MVDSAARQTILRRRMVFLSGALAAVTGCDKGTPPQPPKSVLVGEPDETSSLPTSTPSPSASAPVAKGLPPPPSTAIPETSCEGDRAELEKLKPSLDALYADVDAVYTGLPSACAVTDDGCRPKYEPLAARVAAIEQRSEQLLGMCGCPAPIVDEYVAKHRSEIARRLSIIRDRVAGTTPANEPGGPAWDNLVSELSTPRPCLSCIRCEAKSACD